MSERRGVTGPLFIILSGACFGAMALFARIAYADGVDPITLLFLRFTLATLILSIVAVIRRPQWPNGYFIIRLALLGGVGYVAQSLTYFTALTMAAAGLVALLLYTFPAIVAILSVIFLGERIDRRTVIALVLALSGSFLTIGEGGTGKPLGIMLALLAALLYSIYIVVGSKLTAAAGPLPTTLIVIAAAMSVYAVIALAHGLHLPHSNRGWMAIAAMATISTVFAIGLFFAGLPRVGPTSASMLSTVEPVVTVLLGAIFLHERVGPLQLGGGAAILAAVLILATAKRQAGG